MASMPRKPARLPPAPGALLDVREAAAFLHLGPRKVYDLVAKGEVPHTRAGAKILFDRDALLRWLGGRASGAGSARPVPATVAGSHDPLLEWAVRESRCGLALLTQGSLDGVERLLAGEACAALLHVPAPDLSDFNRPLAEARLRGHDVALVEWATREQGLLVARGNPKRLKGVAQLAGRGVRVAMRQPGSGSRELLERLLAREGIPISRVRAAGEEAMTESDLAASINLGLADAGLGARAAAQPAGLDFVPLLEERVDLAVRRAAWFDPPLQALVAFARTRRFAEHAAALGGYDISRLGTPTWNG
jgi:putative molybdopterin biosynthesis protein